MSVNKFFQSTIASGLALLILLPIGTYVGTKSPLFATVFILHLILLTIAVAFGTKNYLELFRGTTSVSRTALVIGAGALLIALLESRLPVTFRDALIHHLVVPRWWMEEGRIFSPSWHEWSFYPMLLNLGFAGLFALGGEACVASYHWIFGALFALVTASGTAYVLKNRNAGALGFFLAATTPIIFRLASLPIVDCGLALFSALTFFYFIIALDEESSEETAATRSAIVFGALALGLALGTKYNGLPFALSSVLVFVLVRARKNPSSAFTSGVLISVLALAIYSPWMIRDYSLTQNPIYPLYSNIFKPSIERPAGLPNLKPLEQRHLIYQESAVEIALLPLRIFFEGKDDQPAHFDGVLTPLFALSFFGSLFFEKKRLFSYSFGIAVFYLLLSIFLNPLRVRYLAPVFAPLIFITARGLQCALTDGLALRSVASAALAAHLFIFTEYAYQKTNREQLFSFLRGNITTENYLRDRIPEYPLVEYINQNIETDKKIYLLFTGNRFALFKPQTFSGGHFSASVLISWIREANQTRKPLIQFFRDAQIDYLLSDSIRAQQFVLEQLGESERALWTQFVGKRLKFVHEDRGFSLWRIDRE